MIDFTAHNIRLDDGTLTKPDMGMTMDAYPWFVSARRMFETVFPGDRSGVRVADLGCLEGGYAVELARMGFDVTGVEVRPSNMAACRFVKDNVDLPNLRFVQDDARNIAAHGRFDAVFCCGLLYHLDQPLAFLRALSGVTDRMLYIQTHFSTERENTRFNLSPAAENEGVPGRWFLEYPNEQAFRNRDTSRWASWDNRRSFWLRREYLLQALKDAGFDLVLEQFDGLGNDIAGSMTEGYYRIEERGTFVGIKT
jgi:SAM-dependent methyltransferase